MRLSKQEAAAHLGVSTATIERRIQRGELQAEKEPYGSRYRVWVRFEDEPPAETPVATTVATPAETDVETRSQQMQAAEATRVATPATGDMTASVEIARLREQLKSAQERANSLEELAGFHKQALTDADWRYHEILRELSQCQQNLASVTRALPALQDTQTQASVDQRQPRRLWWPFKGK